MRRIYIFGASNSMCVCLIVMSCCHIRIDLRCVHSIQDDNVSFYVLHESLVACPLPSILYFCEVRYLLKRGIILRTTTVVDSYHTLYIFLSHGEEDNAMVMAMDMAKVWMKHRGFAQIKGDVRLQFMSAFSPFLILSCSPRCIS